HPPGHGHERVPQRLDLLVARLVSALHLGADLLVARRTIGLALRRVLGALTVEALLERLHPLAELARDRGGTLLACDCDAAAGERARAAHADPRRHDPADERKHARRHGARLHEVAHPNVSSVIGAWKVTAPVVDAATLAGTPVP